MTTADDLDFEFGEEGENEGGSSSSSQDNKSFAELRKAYNRAERERKALAAEAEELRAFKAEIVTRETETKIQEVFQEVGLNPQHSKLFRALNPDVGPDGVTAEAVAAFASEYALVTTAGEEVTAPELEKKGFTPVVSNGAPPKVGLLDSEDIKRMLDAGDQDGVAKAFREGRVKKETIGTTPWARV